MTSIRRPRSVRKSGTGSAGHPAPQLGLRPDLVLRQRHDGIMRVNAHYGQGRAPDCPSDEHGLAQSLRQAAVPCAATRASQSSQIWSTVRLAAAFGSTMAAARTSRGSPSTAARTASSAGSDVGAVDRRALRRQVADADRVGTEGVQHRRHLHREAVGEVRDQVVVRDVRRDDARGAGLERVDHLRRVLRGLRPRPRGAREPASCSRTRWYSARFSALMSTYSPTFSRSRSTSLGWWRYHGTYSLECSLVSVG